MWTPVGPNLNDITCKETTMKKLLTILALTLGLTFVAVPATPAAAETPSCSEAPGGTTDCTLPPLCSEAPGGTTDCRAPEPDPCQVEQYAAQVAVLTSKVDDLSSRVAVVTLQRDRAQALADRRAATIQRLREKLRASRG